MTLFFQNEYYSNSKIFVQTEDKSKPDPATQLQTYTPASTWVFPQVISLIPGQKWDDVGWSLQLLTVYYCQLSNIIQVIFKYFPNTFKPMTVVCNIFDRLFPSNMAHQFPQEYFHRNEMDTRWGSVENMWYCCENFI